MLLFLSRYPADQPEGMMQRVAAVDRLLADFPRVYFASKSRKLLFPRWEHPAEQVEVCHFNPLLHRGLLDRYARRATAIYVQSIFNAAFAPWIYEKYGHKIITDLHGVVPEEAVMQGQPDAPFARLEHTAVAHSRLLVTVTKAMGRHYLAKYPGLVREDALLCLPIFLDQPASSADRSGPLRCVYAGGIHAWQKIDVMLDAIAAVRDSDMEFRLFFPPEALPVVETELAKRGLKGRVTTGSLPREQLLVEYAQADLGFILRDDHIVNRVAFPTKLMEYLSCGVVPIVLHAGIGDFLEYGYRYLSLDTFTAGGIKRDALDAYRQRNDAVLLRLREDTERELARLRTCCREGGSDVHEA